MVGAIDHREGFTLVEILIVVVILGILAAIVVPQFSSATDTARINTAQENLQTLRTQLEVYAAQHHDGYPPFEDMWSIMLGKTDADGNEGGRFGPYLQHSPVNPFTQSATLARPGQGASDHGWEYDDQTGELSAVGFNEDTGEYTAPQ